MSSYTQPEKNKNVHLTGYVTDLEKLCLLRCCRAFLFPTLGEGFGIPVIEAQMCGAPVLTSNNTSLPEVTNGSAHLINNPLGADEIMNAISILWNCDNERNHVKKKGKINVERFNFNDFKKSLSNVLFF